ncbi:hypothetical protein [Psychromonas antarctica]|uniref:hypothetical protein n=1 Tax=Psychromonas antarctica TaxID=67573 RepID=UPI001EE8B7BC|nr:hypothetical protein [Psychromonas antarctica]MCG6200095.1 hypothetical protein [Psychromonas antarctica]
MSVINKRKQNGVALITVLMILAVFLVRVVTVAAIMSGRLMAYLLTSEDGVIRT